MDVVKLKDYNNIFAVDCFDSEYRELFGKSSGEYLKYYTKLRKNLRILDQELKNSIRYQQFEKLEDSQFYSIRHVSAINPRVIFAYIDNEGKVILLSSCKENKTSDYSNALKRARQRLKILEE